MKKFLLVIMLLFVLVGCQSVQANEPVDKYEKIIADHEQLITDLIERIGELEQEVGNLKEDIRNGLYE